MTYLSFHGTTVRSTTLSYLAKIIIDRRLYSSVTSLRDELRRRLRCEVFCANLAKVMIKYQHKDADGSSDKSADLMNDDWAIINAILHDELNDDFDFQIGLRA
jgi:hypothetical protein